MRQTIYFDLFKPLLFFFLLGMLLLLPTGCSNDDYNVLPDTDSDEYVPVNISFGGIQILFGPYGEEARNVQYNKIHETQDFDRKQMLETLVMAEPDTLRPPLTRSTSPVTNTSVRLVAYDETNSTYMGTGVYDIDASGNVTARDGETLALKPGKYYFHCFSPAQDITISGNTVTVNLPAAGGTTDPAFYYAKSASAQEIPTGANATGVTIPVPELKPQYCKLVLTVSHYSGTDPTYTSAVLNTTLYKDASLALPGGTVTSNSPTTADTPITVSFSNPTIYVYPGSTGSFKMTVNGVEVGGVPKGDITTETNTIGMKMEAGNAYKVSLSITKKNYIQIIDLPFRVAKGNLLYNASTGRWILAPDQGYYYKANGGFETLTANVPGYGNKDDKVYSYFNWGVRASEPNYSGTYTGPVASTYGGTNDTYYGTAFGYNSTAATSASTAVSNYSNNNDPCYAALGGKWHLPTGGSANSDMGYFAKTTLNTSKTGSLQEYTTKSNLSSTQTRTVYGHYFGTDTKPSPENQDNYVFLPAADIRDCDRTGTIYSESSSGNGNYWSSTPHPYKPDNSYALRFYSSSVPDGTDFSNRFRGYSVRCISYE